MMHTNRNYQRCKQYFLHHRKITTRIKVIAKIKTSKKLPLKYFHCVYYVTIDDPITMFFPTSKNINRKPSYCQNTKKCTSAFFEYFLLFNDAYRKKNGLHILYFYTCMIILFK